MKIPPNPPFSKWGTDQTLHFGMMGVDSPLEIVVGVSCDEQVRESVILNKWEILIKRWEKIFSVIRNDENT